MTKYRDNLGHFLNVSIEDTEIVVEYLFKLQDQDGLDLYGDFLKSFVLLHHIKVEAFDGATYGEPLTCHGCSRVMPTHDCACVC